MYLKVQGWGSGYTWGSLLGLRRTGGSLLGPITYLRSVARAQGKCECEKGTRDPWRKEFLLFYGVLNCTHT